MGFNLQSLFQQVMQSVQPAYQQAVAQAQAAPAAPSQQQGRYEWSPDHSSFIDRKEYPNAVWRDADQGGGSEGAQGSAAGWYSYNEGGSGSEGYTPPSYTKLDVPATTFNRLKEAGLWDLKDPNSDTWKYLKVAGTTPNDAAYGRWADPQHDPDALYRALSNAGLMDVSQKNPQLVSDNARAMLDGLNPQFVDQFAQAASNNAAGYWDSIKNNDAITFKNFSNDLGDAARVYRDMFTQTPLGVAAIAFTGGALSAGAGTGAGEVAGSTMGGATGALGTAEASGVLGSAFQFGDVAAGVGAGVGAEATGALGPGGIEDFASGGGTGLGTEGLDLTGLEGFTPNEMGVPELTDFANTPAGATPPGVDSSIFGEEPGAFADQNIGTEFNTQSGISPNADQFVNTNPESQLFDGSGMDQYGYSGEVAPETMAAPNPTGKGLLESSLDWANKNPFVAGMGLQIGGGLLKGIGDNQTAKEVTERKIEGEKELQAQKTAEQLALEEERRKKIQSGSYFDAKVPIKPSGQPLRRPDGSLVYPNTPQPLLASRIA